MLFCVCISSCLLYEHCYLSKKESSSAVQIAFAHPPLMLSRRWMSLGLSFVLWLPAVVIRVLPLVLPPGLTGWFVVPFFNSFKNIEASLAHVDANFFLGKVCFLVTGGTYNQVPTFFPFWSCSLSALELGKLPFKTSKAYSLQHKLFFRCSCFLLTSAAWIMSCCFLPDLFLFVSPPFRSELLYWFVWCWRGIVWGIFWGLPPPVDLPHWWCQHHFVCYCLNELCWWGLCCKLALDSMRNWTFHGRAAVRLETWSNSSCFPSIVGRVNHCSVDMSAVRKLGDVYCSPLIFCELEVWMLNFVAANGWGGEKGSWSKLSSWEQYWYASNKSWQGM